MSSDKHLELLRLEFDRFHDLLDMSEPGSDAYQLAIMALDRLVDSLTAATNGAQLADELLMKAQGPTEIM